MVALRRGVRSQDQFGWYSVGSVGGRFRLPVTFSFFDLATPSSVSTFGFVSSIDGLPEKQLRFLIFLLQ